MQPFRARLRNCFITVVPRRLRIQFTIVVPRIVTAGRLRVILPPPSCRRWLLSHVRWHNKILRAGKEFGSFPAL